MDSLRASPIPKANGREFHPLVLCYPPVILPGTGQGEIPGGKRGSVAVSGSGSISGDGGIARWW